MAISRSRILVVAVFLACPVALGVLGWEFRWMCDDGFINLRVVQNVVDGSGPVFNAGERVEAYTSPLWVGVLTLCRLLSVPGDWAAVGLGVVASVTGILAAQWAALRLRGASPFEPSDYLDGWLVPAGAFVYVAVPVTWDFVTSGLENGLTLGWLGSAFFVVATYVSEDRREPSRHRSLYTIAFLLGLGPLVRPEMTLYSVAFAVPVVWKLIRAERSLSWSRAGSLVAVASLLPVGYQTFRMGYFASLVPNTAVAKAAFHPRWEQGWYYASNFFGLYLLVVPIPLVVIHLMSTCRSLSGKGATSRAMMVATPVVAGLVHIAYVTRLGGGFMHGRLFLPAFFALLMPASFVALRSSRPWWRRGRVVGLVVVVVWAVVCSTTIRASKEKWHGIANERLWYADKAGVSNPVTLEDYAEMNFLDSVVDTDRELGQRCRPETFARPPSANPSRKQLRETCPPAVLVDREKAGELQFDYRFYPLRERTVRAGHRLAVSRITIGMRSLAMGLDVHVVDRAGLASPIASRLKLRDRGRPGHERRLPNRWFVARFAKPVPGEPRQVSAAREALDCGILRRLDRAVTKPVTLERFVANIARALEFYSLVIPRDAARARDRFCGSDGT